MEIKHTSAQAGAQESAPAAPSVLTSSREIESAYKLPPYAVLSTKNYKAWHDLLLRLPAAIRSGALVPSVSPDGQQEATYAAIMRQSPALAEGPARASQALLLRCFHQDLLETVLSHGRERLDTLMTIGDMIVARGLTIPDPRKHDFRQPLRLNDSSLAAVPSETLEAFGHSFRYLLLRTQAWMRHFPVDELQLKDGPSSTTDIKNALEKGLNREFARVYEVAVALACMPKGLRASLMSLSESKPTTPYAELIPLEVELQFRPVGLAGWRLRKHLEPGGLDHPGIRSTGLEDQPPSSRAFVHRLARYRLGSLLQCGAQGLEELLRFGRTAAPFYRDPNNVRPLDEVLSPRPLRGLPVASQAGAKGTVALVGDHILHGLARADHQGWLQTVHTMESTGLPMLKPRTGQQRGDGADVPFEHLPQSTRNRVNLNLLAHNVKLTEDDSLCRFLQRSAPHSID